MSPTMVRKSRGSAVTDPVADAAQAAAAVLAPASARACPSRLKPSSTPAATVSRRRASTTRPPSPDSQWSRQPHRVHRPARLVNRQRPAHPRLQTVTREHRSPGPDNAPPTGQALATGHRPHHRGGNHRDHPPGRPAPVASNRPRPLRSWLPPFTSPGHMHKVPDLPRHSPVPRSWVKALVRRSTTVAVSRRGYRPAVQVPPAYGTAGDGHGVAGFLDVGLPPLGRGQISSPQPGPL